jgi:M6 family metalloprotease-like protein
MKKLLFGIGILGLLGIHWGTLRAMPLEPDFVQRLRREGKLKEVTGAYREAQARWQIDRLPQERTATGERSLLKTRAAVTSGSGIAILIDFSDEQADIVHHPPAAYDTLLFSVNTYRGGSMKDFYIENSYGQFNFSGGVAPKPPAHNWFRSTRTMGYYGQYYGFAHDHELFQEALVLADPTTDFGQYDNDGPDGVPNSGDDDGMVDAVYIVHAGPGYEENNCGKIWSHMGWDDYTTNDPAHNGGFIRIGPYSVQPEEHCNGDLIDVGVFCHEFGHILGLPDLYDYDYDSNGAGLWTLMAAGSWNGDRGSSPAHLDAWCKTKLGWVDPIVVKNYLIAAPLPEIERNPVMYKLWTGGTPAEQYFLVENRQPVGKFDSHLPGSGMLVYHVDEAMSGTNNDRQYIPGESPPGSDHYLVAVEQADGRFDLERNVDAGDDGDPFPGSTHRDYLAGFLPYPTTFNYNEKDTRVAILNISTSDSMMHANLDVGRNLPLFSIQSVSVDDKAGGDGDGRAEPGETAKLSIVLNNRWGDGTGVAGRLVSLDTAVSVLTGTASFGSIPNGGSGNNQTNPFIFKVSTQAQSHPVKFVLELSTNVPGYTKSDTLDLMVGWPGIMLVDDDGGDTLEVCYQSSLDNLHLNYDYWDVSGQGSFGQQLSKMGGNDSIIIWFTGRATKTLSPEDISALSNFLDGGGKLLLTSENAGEDLSGNSFYSNYLHAQFLAPAIQTPLVLGVDGDPISQGDTVAMNYLLADSKDLISPLPPATIVFTYKNIANGGAGIKYKDGYQVVYFSFPVEAAAGNPAQFLQSKELLARVLTWFGLNLDVRETVKPVIGALKFSAHPNPGRDAVNFELELPRSSFASFKIYNANGRLVATLFEGSNLQSNNYRLRWQTTLLPAGVYFCRLENEQSSTVDKVIVLR